MTKRSIALAMGLLAMTGAAAASDLKPGNGHSMHLGRFNGAVYYTVEKDGYRVVATLASGTDEQPIRFVSTLEPGQRLMISVPQEIGQPSVDFEIVRDGKALFVHEPGIAPLGNVSAELRE
ncbi:hypothetical protein [Sinorhizobium terangae]|uniref:DUF2846 domain-containing protein n=1 Tax=Sinorhizobium terangae TaxID=110322 RepID=A0A6N7LBS2_SINTE|nr:hypothetical protein [Sinorhizobium terangae]MBB4187003.1 hypothetical protein [Sinorhizobium terangae]MQX14365.1 hypothetical protein [Sinorhizobium terangae]WFU49923.1 hypothetical protein QA637_24230 [Sinorhizobium terangae]